MFSSIFNTVIALSVLISFVSANNLTGYCDVDEVPRKRLVCVYKDTNNSSLDEFDPCVCNHILYDAVSITDDFRIDEGKNSGLQSLIQLKKKNPALLILVSIRGLDTLIKRKNIDDKLDDAKIKRITQNIEQYLQRRHLDGINLDWKYSDLEMEEAVTEFSYQLTNLVKQLNDTLRNGTIFGGSYPMITITVSNRPHLLEQGYEFHNLSRYLNFVSLPAFRFEHHPTNTIHHVSKLHGIDDMENVDSSIDLLLTLGIPKEKINVGFPTFAIAYILKSENQSTPGSPAESIGNGTELAYWILSHHKWCSMKSDGNWTIKRDRDQTAPYGHSGLLWVGFDDEISLKLKSRYVLLRNLGGITVWSINHDDGKNVCGNGKFPLLKSIRDVLTGLKNGTDNTVSSSEEVLHSKIGEVVKRKTLVKRAGEVGPEEQFSCHRRGYYRHPTDCSLFYRCVRTNLMRERGIVLIYECPRGLVYDDRYEICNWPSWSPPCDGSGEVFPAPRKRFVCPGVGYFQDPENCRWFYYCSALSAGSGRAYEFRCPFALLGFDEERLRCSWRWQVPGCQPMDSHRYRPRNGRNRRPSSSAASENTPQTVAPTAVPVPPVSQFNPLRPISSLLGSTTPFEFTRNRRPFELPLTRRPIGFITRLVPPRPSLLSLTTYDGENHPRLVYNFRTRPRSNYQITTEPKDNIDQSLPSSNKHHPDKEEDDFEDDEDIDGTTETKTTSDKNIDIEDEVKSTNKLSKTTLSDKYQSETYKKQVDYDLAEKEQTGYIKRPDQPDFSRGIPQFPNVNYPHTISDERPGLMITVKRPTPPFIPPYYYQQSESPYYNGITSRSGPRDLTIKFEVIPSHQSQSRRQFGERSGTTPSLQPVPSSPYIRIDFPPLQSGPQRRSSVEPDVSSHKFGVHSKDEKEPIKYSRAFSMADDDDDKTTPSLNINKLKSTNHTFIYVTPNGFTNIRPSRFYPFVELPLVPAKQKDKKKTDTFDSSKKDDIGDRRDFNWGILPTIQALMETLGSFATKPPPEVRLAERTTTAFQKRFGFGTRIRGGAGNGGSGRTRASTRSRPTTTTHPTTEIYDFTTTGTEIPSTTEAITTTTTTQIPTTVKTPRSRGRYSDYRTTPERGRSRYSDSNDYYDYSDDPYSRSSRRRGKNRTHRRGRTTTTTTTTTTPPPTTTVVMTTKLPETTTMTTIPPTVLPERQQRGRGRNDGRRGRGRGQSREKSEERRYHQQEQDYNKVETSSSTEPLITVASTKSPDILSTESLIDYTVPEYTSSTVFVALNETNSIKLENMTEDAHIDKKGDISNETLEVFMDVSSNFTRSDEEMLNSTVEDGNYTEIVTATNKTIESSRESVDIKPDTRSDSKLTNETYSMVNDTSTLDKIHETENMTDSSNQTSTLKNKTVSEIDQFELEPKVDEPKVHTVEPLMKTEKPETLEKPKVKGISNKTQETDKKQEKTNTTELKTKADKLEARIDDSGTNGTESKTDKPEIEITTLKSIPKTTRKPRRGWDVHFTTPKTEFARRTRTRTRTTKLPSRRQKVTTTTTTARPYDVESVTHIQPQTSQKDSNEYVNPEEESEDDIEYDDDDYTSPEHSVPPSRQFQQPQGRIYPNVYSTDSYEQQSTPNVRSRPQTPQHYSSDDLEDSTDEDYPEDDYLTDDKKSQIRTFPDDHLHVTKGILKDDNGYRSLDQITYSAPPPRKHQSQTVSYGITTPQAHLPYDEILTGQHRPVDPPQQFRKRTQYSHYTSQPYQGTHTSPSGVYQPLQFRSTQQSPSNIYYTSQPYRVTQTRVSEVYEPPQQFRKRTEHSQRNIYYTSQQYKVTQTSPSGIYHPPPQFRRRTDDGTFSSYSFTKRTGDIAETGNTPPIPLRGAKHYDSDSDKRHLKEKPTHKQRILDIPFTSDVVKGNDTNNIIPEIACTRPGLFYHPDDCNKFYECYWDKWIEKFTLHMFECPVKLEFDNRLFGCNSVALGPCDKKKDQKVTTNDQ